MSDYHVPVPPKGSKDTNHGGPSQANSRDWAYQKHHTISADHTTETIVEQNLLLAATGSQKTTQQPRSSPPQSEPNIELSGPFGPWRDAKPEVPDAVSQDSLNPMIIMDHHQTDPNTHALPPFIDYMDNRVANLQMNGGRRPPRSHPGPPFNAGQINQQHMIAARRGQQQAASVWQPQQSQQHQVPQMSQRGQWQLARQSPESQSQRYPNMDQQRATQNCRPNGRPAPPVLPYYNDVDSISGHVNSAGGLGSWKGTDNMGTDGSRTLLGDVRHHTVPGEPPNGIEHLSKKENVTWGDIESQADGGVPTEGGTRQKLNHRPEDQTALQSTVPSEMANDASQNRRQSPTSEPCSINELKRQIQELQRENKRMKRSGAEPGLGQPTWQVFHCIDKKDPYTDEQDYEVARDTFLAEPSWAVVDDRLLLKGHLPISDPIAYMRRKPNVAFVVYNYYKDEHRLYEAEAALQKNEPLPSPRPAHQSIQIVSAEMTAATEEFLKMQPNFSRDFPVLNVRYPMQAPYMWWYQYRRSRMLERLPPGKGELLRILTTWIDENYKKLYDQVDAQIRRGMVSYASMGFLIKPGDVLVSKVNDSVECHLAISWLYPVPERPPTGDLTVNQSQEEPSQHPSTWPWTVDCESYCYDGVVRKRTMPVEIQLHTASAEDEVSIGDLDAVPLRFLDQNVHTMLAHRGKTFWGCRKRRLVSYKDEASDLSCAQGQRFMVDYHTYNKIHPESTSETKPTEPKGIEMPRAVFDCDEPPEEPDLLLLPNEVKGFELRRKKWRKLKVDLIQEVSWNRQAFDHLVASSNTKEIIQALITNQLSAERGTDIIANKGNGLIMLLHGGPGTGKTFTAESVAEMAERPLYPVTCGDIGTKPEQVEAYLESVFHLGKLWGCVVLLDEAEVFLEQRSLSDLDRNALVSVFLRALEYYEGILILTSNRVGTFDEAFKSRIQLALHYEPLRKPQRRQIWKNFFDRLDSMGENRIDFGDIDRHLDRLSEYLMNGRQIRNAITTARQLAQYKDETMMFTHLRHAIEVTGEFDKYLEGVHRGHADDDIAREEGVR